MAERFRAAEPGERVWTWSPDHSVGFWQRMQAIEAAVHRWDVENVLGTAGPLDAAFAVDAIGQTFEVLAPVRRAMAERPTKLVSACDRPRAPSRTISLRPSRSLRLVAWLRGRVPA